MSIETAFTQFPILTTPRLVLRQIQRTDDQALYEFLSDPIVRKYGGSPPHQSLEDTQAFIEAIQSAYKQRQTIRWGITYAGNETVIGTCGFHHFTAEYRCAETGYNLHLAHWGKGVMREAMTAVLEYGFMTLNFHRIEAVIDDANERSKALLLKFGFRYEGRLRERFFVRNRFEDEYYYGLLKSEWLEHPLHIDRLS
jgi:[ribosomal protein S5]-alanine N-acetyltransferase